MNNIKGSSQLPIQMTEALQEAGKTGLFEIDIKQPLFIGSGACYKILGIPKKAGTTKLTRILNLIHKKSEREKIEKYFIAPGADGHYFEIEFHIRTRSDDDRKVKTLQMICSTVASGGEVMIQGFLRDISAEKKIERELLKSRYKAESANRFKSVFLTNLGHELRTPMNAIIGFSELLKSGQAAERHLEEYLSIIKNKGNYLLSLIDDVIELSRFETGDVTISKSSFSVNAFMLDLYSEFENRRKEKDKEHIELQMELPEEYNDVVLFTDPGRLHQVLASILSNAFKFTDKGKVEFGFFESEKNYKFYVSDTGIGLSKDDQRRIFNRFEDVEETALPRLAGTGLSLTIARKIIEQMGGKIKVRSEINKGSWFQVTVPKGLPVKSRTDMIHETWNIRNVNWKDKVILIAEDEELNFRFLEALLQRTQAKVLRAKNGKEAVDLCKNISHIDMILMDIKMPVMSGNEATVEIKKNRPEIPVIAQTAFSIQEEIAKCKEAGCDDYVTKPIDIKMLIKKMGHFLHK